MSAARKPRHAMVMNTRACVGCNACVLACKAENRVPHGYFRDWVVQEVRGVMPALAMQNRSERCMHCTDAPCVSVCPTGASHYHESGEVLVAHEKCTGCKACIASCPYDARFVHPAGYVDKCTFCIHRTERGDNPACVTTCPTSALTFGDLNDPDSAVRQLLREHPHQVLKKAAGTHPNLFFLT